MGSKPEMVIGSGVPSWTRTIPGPGTYDYATDSFKARQPAFTMGKRLPTESDIMSKRSPSCQLSTSAADAYRKGSPHWSMGAKPEMVVGDVVPSWGKTIPGPGAYSYETDSYKLRKP